MMLIARKTVDWVLLATCTSLIYVTLPMAPSFYQSIQGYTSGMFRLYINSVFLVIGIGTVGYLSLASISGKMWRYLSLMGITLGYGFFLATTELPSERIHFLEYGLLSWPLMMALKHHFSGPNLLLVAGLIISLLGFIDEVIQWILPNRYFELKDVGMNTAGGLLGILLVRFVFVRNREF